MGRTVDQQCNSLNSELALFSMGPSIRGWRCLRFFHNFIAKNRTLRPTDTTHAASHTI
jgi:hypothetical protein